MNERRDPKERCSTALGHLRLVWAELVDGGCAERFREPMTRLTSDIKLALGGEEKDGFDKAKDIS